MEKAVLKKIGLKIQKARSQRALCNKQNQLKNLLYSSSGVQAKTCKTDFSKRTPKKRRGVAKRCQVLKKNLEDEKNWYGNQVFEDWTSVRLVFWGRKELPDKQNFRFPIESSLPKTTKGK